MMLFVENRFQYVHPEFILTGFKNDGYTFDLFHEPPSSQPLSDELINEKLPSQTDFREETEDLAQKENRSHYRQSH